jgi:hypothetical protein
VVLETVHEWERCDVGGKRVPFASHLSITKLLRSLRTTSVASFLVSAMVRAKQRWPPLLQALSSHFATADELPKINTVN